MSNNESMNEVADDNFVDLTLDDDEEDAVDPTAEHAVGQGGGVNPAVNIKKEESMDFKPIPVSSSEFSTDSPHSDESPDDEEDSVAMDGEATSRYLQQWSEAEKRRLYEAKRNGLTWDGIRKKYFPLRTVNACRQAHRRFFGNAEDHERERDEEDHQNHDGGRDYHQSVATLERDEVPPKWSREEKELLARLVRQYGKNWKKIQLFISGRNANACAAAHFKYIQRREGSTKSPGNWKRPTWSEDELNRLGKLARKYGRKWDTIEQYFPGRSSQSCATAYSRYLSNREPSAEDPAREWTPQEKLRFHKAYNETKNDWDRIAAKVGRSQTEIADYYDYVYLPELMKMASERYSAEAGTIEQDQASPEDTPVEESESCDIQHRASSRISWTAQEDELLCELYEKFRPLFEEGKINYGGLFELVAERMPGRSVGACREHFRCNFRDRKRERERTSSDFSFVGYESDVSIVETTTRKKSKTVMFERAATSKRNWSDQEKEKFHELFVELGTNNWDAIADRMLGRDIQACKNYYYRTYRFLKTSEPEQSLEEDSANRVDRTERSERHEPSRTRDVVFSAAVPSKRAASVFTKSDIRTQLYAMISAMGSNSADRVAAMKVVRFLGDKNLNEVIEDIILQIQVDKPAMTAQAATLAFYAQALEVMKESENWKSEGTSVHK